MRIAVAIFLICLFGSAVSAQDDKQAVCKDANIPPDRVIIGEFQSAGCTPPETNNAWDTVVPKDGTVICQKRSIKSTARVLELELCDRVMSNSCPAKLDGTANSFVLRSPVSCLAKKEDGFRMACMLDPHFDFGHELLVGGMKTKDCKWADSEFANAYVFRKRSDPYSVAKTCWLGEWAGQKLEWDDVILRWFHSDYCNFYKSGIFNTVMIVKLSRRPSPETLLCTGTAMISGSEPDAVSTLEPGAVIYRGADVELVYTPLCGIDEHERPNAKRILRSAGGTRDDDNPWK